MQPKQGSPLTLNCRVSPGPVCLQGEDRRWAQTAQVLSLVLLPASLVTLNTLLRLPDPCSPNSTHLAPCAGSSSGPGDGQAFSKLQRVEDLSGPLDVVPLLSKSSSICEPGFEPIPALFARGARASPPALFSRTGVPITPSAVVSSKC